MFTTTGHPPRWVEAAAVCYAAGPTAVLRSMERFVGPTARTPVAAAGERCAQEGAASTEQAADVLAACAPRSGALSVPPPPSDPGRSLCPGGVCRATRYAEPPGTAQRAAEADAVDPNAPALPSVAAFDARRADRMVVVESGRVAKWLANTGSNTFLEATAGPPVRVSDRLRFAAAGTLVLRPDPGVPGLGCTVVFRALNAALHPYPATGAPALVVGLVPAGGSAALNAQFGPAGLRLTLVRSLVVDLFQAPLVPDTTGTVLYTLALFVADRSATVVLHTRPAAAGAPLETQQETVAFPGDWELDPAACRVTVRPTMVDVHHLTAHRVQPDPAAWRSAVDDADAPFRGSAAVEPAAPVLPSARFDAGNAAGLVLGAGEEPRPLVRWNAADGTDGDGRPYAESVEGVAAPTGTGVRWTAGPNRLAFRGHLPLPGLGLALVFRPLNAARHAYGDGGPDAVPPVRITVGPADGSARFVVALGPAGLDLELSRDGDAAATTSLLHDASVVPDTTGGTLYTLGMCVRAGTTTVVLRRRTSTGALLPVVQTAVDVKARTGYELVVAVLGDASVEGSMVDVYRMEMRRGVTDAAAWTAAVAALDAGVPGLEPWDHPPAVFDARRTGGMTFSGTDLSQWNADAPVGAAVCVQTIGGAITLGSDCLRLPTSGATVQIGVDLPMPSLGIALVVRPRGPAADGPDGPMVAPYVRIRVHNPAADGAPALEVTLGPAGLDVRLLRDGVDAVDLFHAAGALDGAGAAAPVYTLGVRVEPTSAAVVVRRRAGTGPAPAPIAPVVALPADAGYAAGPTAGSVAVEGALVDVQRIDVHRGVNDPAAWSTAVSAADADVPATAPWELPVAVFDAGRYDTLQFDSKGYGTVYRWDPVVAVVNAPYIVPVAGTSEWFMDRLRCRFGTEELRVQGDVGLPRIGLGVTFRSLDAASRGGGADIQPEMGLGVHTADDTAAFRVEFGPTGLWCRLLRDGTAENLLHSTVTPDATSGTLYTLGLLVAARTVTVVLHRRKNDGTARLTQQDTVNVFEQTGYELPPTAGYAAVRPSMLDVYGARVHRAVDGTQRWIEDVAAMDADVRSTAVVTFDARTAATSMVLDPANPGAVLRWNAEPPVGGALFFDDGGTYVDSPVPHILEGNQWLWNNVQVTSVSIIVNRLIQKHLEPSAKFNGLNHSDGNTAGASLRCDMRLQHHTGGTVSGWNRIRSLLRSICGHTVGQRSVPHAR